MIVIHVNWMLILYCFIGAVGLATLKYLVNYILLSKGWISRATTYQNHYPPERVSISINIDETRPPEFEEALKYSKPVYRIDIDEEPPPPYHLVMINSK